MAEATNTTQPSPPAPNPDARWERLNEFLASADLTKLTSVQKVVYLADSYAGHIVMAGHEDYFSTTPEADHSEVIAALSAIGATEQASILKAALDAVRAAGERAPKESSNRFLAGVEFADLSEFDEAFKHCARSVPECLLDYMGKHESEFIVPEGWQDILWRLVFRRGYWVMLAICVVLLILFATGVFTHEKFGFNGVLWTAIFGWVALCMVLFGIAVLEVALAEFRAKATERSIWGLVFSSVFGSLLLGGAGWMIWNIWRAFAGVSR